MSKRGAISRGDLLHAFHRLQVDSGWPFEDSVAEALGFETREQAYDTRTTAPDSYTPQHEGTPQGELRLDAALTQFGIWVCNACTRNTGISESPEKKPRVSVPIRRMLSEPAVHPLHRSAQLLNLWDDTLADVRHSHRLDVLRIVKTLSKAKPIQSLPRLTRSAFSTELVLMLDLRARLRPLWLDQLALYVNLDQLLGNQCSLITLCCDPERLLNRSSPDVADEEEELPVDARVVIVSDFDAMESDRIVAGNRGNAWRDWLQVLVGRGNQVITLGVEGCAPSPLASHRGLLGDARRGMHMQALIAAMSRGHLCSVERLRFFHDALRESGAKSLATEIAVWNHPDRKSTNTGQWSMKSNRRGFWLDKYHGLATRDRERLDRAIKRWRDSLYADQAGLEALIDGSAGFGDAPDGEAFAKALQIGSKNAEGENRLDSWLFSAHDLFCDVAKVYEDVHDLQPLLKVVQQHARQFGLRQPLGLTHIADAGNSIMFFEQIGQDLGASVEPGLCLVWKGSSPYLDSESEQVIQFGDRLNRDEYTLQSATHQVQFKRLYIPRWADSFCRDSDGNVLATHQDGVTFRFLPADASRSAAEWKESAGKWSWANRTGIDEYGLWAEFTVNKITQRLRWIPPGKFLMGSPEDEPERDDDETQHHVTLTEGYWLAETACTQALWEAVRGNNPSQFKGSDRPVEMVSWNEVKDFIKQLNDKVPGLQSRLPTEAEWEYAARAGTQTPFWWGSTLSSEQANYDGNLPYADGEKGKFREETVPVKEFEPNPWGLYQVYGNVWEWCEDWNGEYKPNAVVNPDGAESGGGRVCRGGGWDYDGGGLRAACRDGNVPGSRNRILGFRLSAGQSGAEPR